LYHCEGHGISGASAETNRVIDIPPSSPKRANRCQSQRYGYSTNTGIECGPTTCACFKNRISAGSACIKNIPASSACAGSGNDPNAPVQRFYYAPNIGLVTAPAARGCEWSIRTQHRQRFTRTTRVAYSNTSNLPSTGWSQAPAESNLAIRQKHLVESR